ncbi:undecaprenyl-diphosphatase [Candidatus Dependentiae bacterium Noda2021]|nr:undecaprenyl-diphosphatase [Candidatus Dependentiae bacterium Noda2021]
MLEKLLSSSFFDTHGLLSSLAVQQKISFFIHAPSALIIAVFFFKDWFFLLQNYKTLYPYIARIIGYSAIANTITIAVYGIKHTLALNTQLFLPWGFVITMLLLLTLYWVKDRTEPMTWSKAIVVGLMQGCALMPGISRFAATYVAARWLGLSARRGMQVSFVVQFPLIALASVFGLVTMPRNVRDMLFSIQVMTVIVAATFLAYLLLQWTYNLACAHKLQRFSWYMVVPFLISLLLV